MLTDIVAAAKWQLLLCCFIVSGQTLVTVNTKLGKLTGEEISFDGNNVHRFRGIRYAKPPIGDLRFKKPEPYGNLGDINVTAFGNECASYSPFTATYKGDEDCLTLNIYKPRAAAANNRVAVMVWIHGGGYIEGSSVDYPGEVLAALGNVIVVTLNYRLSILGFFVSKDSEIPPNLGLWDQHLALNWVKDNIAEFGGDSSSITIFGESAGGSAVMYQMFSLKNSKETFQRVIAESAWTNYLAEVNRDIEAFDETQKEKLNCANMNLLECMKGKSTKELIMAANSGVFSIFPYADGEFLSKDLGYAFIDFTVRNTTKVSSDVVGGFYDYDLMAGWNSDEGTMFGTFILGSLNDINYENVKMQLSTMLYSKATGSYMSQDSVLEAIMRFYLSSPDSWLSDGRSYSNRLVEALIKIIGDASLKVPNIQWLQFHSMASSRPSYAYEFDYKSRYPLMDLKSWDWLRTGAQHAEEIAYIFGLPIYQEFATKSALGFPNATDEEQALSRLMVKMWSDFAKSGNPGNKFEVFKYPRDQAYTKIRINETQVMNYPLSAELRLFSTLQRIAMETSQTVYFNGSSNLMVTMELITSASLIALITHMLRAEFL